MLHREAGLLASPAFPNMGIAPDSVRQQMLLSGPGTNEEMLVWNTVALWPTSGQ